jgi:hypothetical protein
VAINRTGLSFTVDASVPSGGIAPLRDGDGQGNAHGAWRFQQLVWQHQVYVGDLGSRDKVFDTQDDSPLKGNYSIKGNHLQWVDAPGFPTLVNPLGNLIRGESFTNLIIRGWRDGKMGCEVRFSIHFVYESGQPVATWQQKPF